MQQATFLRYVTGINHACALQSLLYTGSPTKLCAESVLIEANCMLSRVTRSDSTV